MQIDRPKLTVAIGVAVMLETAIGGGTLSLTDAVPAHLIPTVQAWCNILAFIGSTILTGLSAYAGPSTGVLASPPTIAQAQQVMAAAKTAAVLLLCALVFWPADARAQATPKPRPALTGDPIADVKNAIGGGAAQVEKNAQDRLMQILAKPFNDLADFITSDAEAAMALATAIPELQDGHGQQCWKAMGVFTKVVKAHPIPVTLHAATDLQAIRLAAMAANNLCQDPHCTQVFADLANGVQKAAPVNFGIPIPSLNSLCALVPQVSVVAPIAVPAVAPANPLP